ncbi:hypothetical protein HHX47_DHR9000283 [Lentinula edodes]|nr:hypothetical protein HHX47_DHR9000283 [Lentinula edodes]
MERPRNSDVVGGSTSGCRSSSRKRGKFLDAPVVTRHGRVEFLMRIRDTDSTLTVAQLLFLEAEDTTKPIHLYINSPGGSVTAGLAIYDTPSGGASGQASDIAIHAKEILRIRELLTGIYQKHCGKPEESLADGLKRFGMSPGLFQSNESPNRIVRNGFGT